MEKSKTNITLIGMAGSGKSVIGRMVADKLSRDFVDTDTLIEQAVGCPLQEILDSSGIMEFRRIEENVLLQVNCSNYVIATGGSSVYSHAGMMHLKEDGHLFLLEVERQVLEKRIRNFATRGLVKRPEQSFAEIFIERQPLYQHYADTTISCSKMSREQVCNTIINMFVPRVN